jgi:putative Mn2+ efflux pump MntP
MTIWEILLLALSLSADCFSVAAAVGARYCAPRQVLRLSLSFGAFQCFNFLAGGFIGQALVDLVKPAAPWIAFGLLALIGGKMFFESLRGKEEEAACRESDPTCGWPLVGLSLATSIDSLGAGLGLALVSTRWRLLLASLIIGLTAASAGWLGMHSGRLARTLAGRWIEIAAGLVLIGLGVKMLLA